MASLETDVDGWFSESDGYGPEGDGGLDQDTPTQEEWDDVFSSDRDNRAESDSQADEPGGDSESGDGEDQGDAGTGDAEDGGTETARSKDTGKDGDLAKSIEKFLDIGIKAAGEIIKTINQSQSHSKYDDIDIRVPTHRDKGQPAPKSARAKPRVETIEMVVLQTVKKLGRGD